MTNWNDQMGQGAADAVLAVLDDDLAATVRGLPWERRVTDDQLLAIQQIRLIRQLVEQLHDGRNRSEARSHG